MSERVKAKSYTFAELLRDCFANYKDNVFQYRLRIACERASELQSCFLDAGHKGRFHEGVTLADYVIVDCMSLPDSNFLTTKTI